MIPAKRWVLAFDIERAGPTPDYDTIAIGASVVDGDFNELDSLFVPGYIQSITLFETQCWTEFWSKHQDTLDKLRRHGSMNPAYVHNDMIVQFQAFRKKWEQQAAAMGATLELCSDNNVFDGGFVNRMIHDAKAVLQVPRMPIPFTVLPDVNGKENYGSFWETHSMQRGLLMAVDPTFIDNGWGYTDHIKTIYCTPDKANVHAHDHLPHHDAFTIACDLQILHAIREGRIVRRPKKEIE
jgi:hypothetical protein